MVNLGDEGPVDPIDRYLAVGPELKLKPPVPKAASLAINLAWVLARSL